MTGLNLAFLLFDYFPYGGLQRDCLGVANACARRGHRVSILTRTWKGDRPPGIEVHLFGRRGLTLLARNRHWISQLRTDLPQRQLDGIVGFNKLPGLDVYFGSDPCFVAKAARLKPFWFRWTTRYCHYRALEEAVFRPGQKTHLLLLTPHEIPLYQHHYGTERERFEVLPPGIARADFNEGKRQPARLRIRAEIGASPEAQVILFVGSGFRVKGLDRLIKALAAWPHPTRPQLLVAGESAPGSFKRLAQRLGVKAEVRFLGGRNDVSELMLAADLLALPSRSESAGMVLLEALTVGLPVLTTDACGYAFHIERAGAGRVLPSPFNQEQMNQDLAEMLTSPERANWSKAGLAYAAHEDLYSCHERAAELIEQAVSAKRSSCSS